MDYEELFAGFAEKVFKEDYRPENTYYVCITSGGVSFYYREPDSSEYKRIEPKVPVEEGKPILDEEKPAEDPIVHRKDSCLWKLLPYSLFTLLLIICLVIVVLLIYGGFLNG